MISRQTARWTTAIGAVLLAVSLVRPTPGGEPEKITNNIGMKLVLIPAGEFMMGAEESRTDTLNDFPYCAVHTLERELPRHKVRITRPFYMGQYSVTLGEFLIFYHDAHYKLEMERDGNPSSGYSGGRMIKSPNFRPWAPGWDIGMDHPVCYVSWNDAVAFCAWLSKREGKTYRLPTEAEWEYACRAGTNTRYFFGNDPEDLVYFANAADADHKGLSPDATIAKIDKDGKKVGASIKFPFLTRRDGYAWTAPVGRFRPNGFGLYDMHGNVSQWCSDWLDTNYYEKSPVDDPKGPVVGSLRVGRGGGFDSPPLFLRCAFRGFGLPSFRHPGVGFRVVCER